MLSFSQQFHSLKRTIAYSLDMRFVLTIGLLGMLLSTVYFINEFSQIRQQTQASTEIVSVSFNQQNAALQPNDQFQLNILFNSSGNTPISAGSVVLQYPQNVLEYIYTPQDQAEATCMGNNFGLRTILREDHDANTGTLAITRGSMETTANLPSGNFCFGTVTFRAKPGVISSQAQAIRFTGNAGAEPWEIVGPQANFQASYDSTRVVAVTVGDLAPTPTSAIADTTRPSISIISPSNGARVSRNSTVRIRSNATDNVAVSKVEFFIDQSLVCTIVSAPYNCSWDVPSRKNVWYTITAVAHDTSGNTNSARIGVRSR